MADNTAEQAEPANEEMEDRKVIPFPGAMPAPEPEPKEAELPPECYLG